MGLHQARALTALCAYALQLNTRQTSGDVCVDCAVQSCRSGEAPFEPGVRAVRQPPSSSEGPGSFGILSVEPWRARRTGEVLHGLRWRVPCLPRGQLSVIRL